MSARTLRIVLRWVHIVIGLILLCYIYSPFSQYAPFRFVVKWVAVPVLVVSGIWIWKFAAFNKFFRIR